MGGGEIMIALEDLSVAVGNFRLDRISLQISDREYLVLLGPSGAGKTVVLEAIAGLRVPDSGMVTINRRNMAGVPPEHRGTALVYQDYSLFPHMTVAENVAYGLKMQKRSVLETVDRVDALLTDFGISSLKNRYPGSLSGGEQQRVAIARALATEPTVLLLDEPFASLDPNNRDECIRVMHELKESQPITVIQVSHSIDEAYALADTVAVLIDGRIAQTGTPDEIFSHPRSLEVAQFIGMENVLTGIVMSNESGRSQINVGPVRIMLPTMHQTGAKISIGIPAGFVRVVSERPVLDDQGMNSIPCVVRHVTFGKDTATIRLEGSIPLTATMQRTYDDHQMPMCGMKVYAIFRHTDVRVLSEA
jgi:molybdate/tungstate transport system ATP-binding protein